MKRVLDQVSELNPYETSLETASIMTYELGDLVKMLFYSKVYPKDKDVYMIEAKISLSDILAQCHVICEREGWNFIEIDILGKERLFERVQRHIDKGE